MLLKSFITNQRIIKTQK